MESDKHKLGNMELETTQTYKYLGETINDRMNLKDHIETTKGKTEAAYQTVLTIARDRKLLRNRNGIHVETRRNMCNTCNHHMLEKHGSLTKKKAKT